MRVKLIETEWYQDYKLPSMFIAFPTCTFKCEKENEACSCHNSSLAKAPSVEISCDEIVRSYINNPITKAIVCGGLEPMDSFEDLVGLISELRIKYKCNDDVVIYTGYTYEECKERRWIKPLEYLGNVVVKFGRFIPNSASHFDNILGVTLASPNQHAFRLNL